jgi:hypothetical protein
MARDRRTVLIVYYSETGHTEGAVAALDKALDATVERIEAPGLAGHRGFWAFVWRALSALSGRAAAIAPPRHDPAGFDLVVLASPVWAGRLATPMRGYLRRFARRVGPVAWLVTQSGENPGRAFADFAALTGQTGIARLALSDADRAQFRDAKKIADLVSALNAAAPPS